MIRLVIGVRLTNVISTGKTIFTDEPLQNHKIRRQLLKKSQQKATAAKTLGRSDFPSLVIFFGWNLHHQEGTTDFYLKKHEDQYRLLSATDITRYVGTVGHSTR